MKFFVSYGVPDTAVGAILLVAFSRWRVERCFEEGKGEIGLDHYQGRRHPGLKRHLIFSGISYLFLATPHQRLRGEESELTVCQEHTAVLALIRSWRLSRQVSQRTTQELQRTQGRAACARRRRTKRTCRILRNMGIKLTNTPAGEWNSR